MVRGVQIFSIRHLEDGMDTEDRSDEKKLYTG